MSLVDRQKLVSYYRKTTRTRRASGGTQAKPSLTTEPLSGQSAEPSEPSSEPSPGAVAQHERKSRPRAADHITGPVRTRKNGPAFESLADILDVMVGTWEFKKAKFKESKRDCWHDMVDNMSLAQLDKGLAGLESEWNAVQALLEQPETSAKTAKRRGEPAEVIERMRTAGNAWNRGLEQQHTLENQVYYMTKVRQSKEEEGGED